MTEQQADPEALFVAHLPFFERVVETVAQVLGIRGDDAEDFALWAKERLWQGDYAILRKWRGESRFSTYLMAVATNLGREFRVQRWGRWRPSVAARRLGPLAIRLETLVYRDGASLPAAGTLLRGRGETALTDRELARLLDQLPARQRPRRVPDEGVEVERLADDARPDDALLAAEGDATRRAAYAALTDALRRLPADGRTLVEMHYLHGYSLADVARALNVPQKPLYRLRDRMLALLAEELRRANVTADVVRELLGGAIGSASSPEVLVDASPGAGESWRALARHDAEDRPMPSRSERTSS